MLINEGGSRLEHFEAWLSVTESDALLTFLQTLPTRQNRLRMFGKWVDEPRLTAWFGPAYTYSNIQWPAAPMPQTFQPLLRRIQEETGEALNAVLINQYRTGQDGMGWHRDNEREIDQTLVASLSVGSTRKFSVKPMDGEGTVSLDLAHGDLVLMWELQERWKHAVLKTKREVGERFNLTFRRIHGS